MIPSTLTDEEYLILKKKRNIFSPVLKQEIMISGTGFLAVAAREAANSARAEERNKAERAVKKVKLALEASKQETQTVKQEAELKARLTVMRSWNKGNSIDFIADVFDKPYDEVSQLIAVFENVKTLCGSKTNVDINELVKLSGLTELEIKTLLMLLEK